MKLSKQIYLLLFVIISSVFIFFGTKLIGIEYHVDQYESMVNLENELNGLGDRFSEYIAKDDLKSFESTVYKVLEEKKYEFIKITSSKGKVIFNEKIENDYDKHKKNWILDKYDVISNIIKVPVIFNGEKIATIEALVFKEYLQSVSWENIELVLVKILILYFVFIVISFIGTFFVLKPFKKMINQINSLSSRKYFIDSDVYYASDVQEAVEGLNKISNKLRKSFNNNNEFCELVRKNAYKDPTTNLANSKYFENNLEQMLRGSESGIGGLIVKLRFDVGTWSPEKLQAVIKGLNDCANERSSIKMLSYFGNNVFGFIVKDVVPDKDGLENQAKDYAEFLINKLSNIKFKTTKESSIKVYIGITEYQQGTFVADLLKQAEVSLNSASEKTESSWVKYAESSKVSLLPNIDWKDYLKNLLADENYILQYQPVFYYEKDGTLLFHNESLVRIKNVDKSFVYSGTFLPIVNKHNLGVALDSSIINTLLKRIEENEEGWQRYGVNLSCQSLRNAKFLQWLKKRLSKAGEFARRLTFEFKESDARNNVEFLRQFIDVVSEFKIQVGIDHFGRGFLDYNYLEHLKIAYIKVDGSFTKNINANPDNQTIMRSFIEVAHDMDMLLIATCVETEEERVTLSNLHVDGMQGFWIGQPI